MPRVPEKARLDAPAVPHSDQEQHQEHQARASEQRCRRTPCRIPREQHQQGWKQGERDRADDAPPPPEETSKGGGTKSGCRFKRNLVAHVALYVTDARALGPRARQLVAAPGVRGRDIDVQRAQPATARVLHLVPIATLDEQQRARA